MRSCRAFKVMTRSLALTLKGPEEPLHGSDHRRDKVST